MGGNGKPLSPPGAAFATTILFLLFRCMQRIDAQPLLVWSLGGLTLYGAWLVAQGLFAAVRWNWLFKAMTIPIGLYGRTHVPTARDADTLGLRFDNKDGNGIPLGGVGTKVVYYDGPGHISVRAATNAGKTESSAAPICFALGAHRNIIATAKGAELAWLCATYRRDVLKQNVVFIDPWRLMRKLKLPSHDFNAVGHFPNYVAEQSPELIDKAFAASQILLPEAAGASGENKFSARRRAI